MVIQRAAMQTVCEGMLSCGGGVVASVPSSSPLSMISHACHASFCLSPCFSSFRFPCLLRPSRRCTFKHGMFSSGLRRGLSSKAAVEETGVCDDDGAGYRGFDEALDLGGEIECIGTGSDVELVVPSKDNRAKFTGIIAARAVNIKNPPVEQGILFESGEARCDTAIEKQDEQTSIITSDLSSLLVADNETSELSSSESNVHDSATLRVGSNVVASNSGFVKDLLELLLLISPFFFWGTAMVAMKGVLPKTGPLFVAALRLIPAGILLCAFATLKRRKQPSGIAAWFAIAIFGIVDATCFQGFLVEGLKRTSAGLGSVIIDSQPLTVAVLATILFGESLGALGVVGMATGIIGLLLLEVPVQVIEDSLRGHDIKNMLDSVSSSMSLPQGKSWTFWDSGEWWMLLAAQSMAVGTVMVRWVSQYCDPIMATGWHMVLGGIPLLAFSAFQHELAFSGYIEDIQVEDWLALLYTSVFGSAISYGIFFYNASKGSLTRLSSLTFLTPMFATLFGYIFLDEILTPTQVSGALITLMSIYLVNRGTTDSRDIP